MSNEIPTTARNSTLASNKIEANLNKPADAENLVQAFSVRKRVRPFSAFVRFDRIQVLSKQPNTPGGQQNPHLQSPTNDQTTPSSDSNKNITFYRTKSDNHSVHSVVDESARLNS